MTELIDRFLQTLQQRRAFRMQCASGIAQRHLARGAMKQTDAELLFEPVDLQAHLRLGNAEALRCRRDAAVPRLLVVGGAGSLEVAPGVQLVDTPEFPAQWKGTAEGARDVLHLLRQEDTLNWTMLSPSAMIAPGERTGSFRLGTDQLLVDAKGESRISVEDYAVAMIDELEKPAHARRRFTVGY